jgi:regulatory protein
MLSPQIVHYCKYQERCHSEVRNKLYELGFTSVSVEEQISLLIQADILNEERFARAYTRGKWRMKQWGKQKIIYQLRQKKISDYCIRKGLSEIDEVEYEQILDDLATKKCAELKSEKNIFTKRAKIYRFLAQKGFETDLIKPVVAKLTEKKK